MTKYVYDDTRRAIVRLEPQIPDLVAEDVCVLASGDELDTDQLVAELNRLVAGLWHLHDRPSGFGEFERVRFERMRGSMDAMGRYVGDVSSPASGPEDDDVQDEDLPHRSDPETEMLDQLSRGVWDEVPHVAGVDLQGPLRELRHLLTEAPPDRDAVISEVVRQAAAVMQARLGDYSGEAIAGAWRERGHVEPLLLASALRTVGSQVEGGWYPTGERARQLIEQVGVDAAAAAWGELLHVAVHATAEALGYGSVDQVLADAEAYEAIDYSLVVQLTSHESGVAAVEQLLDDAAHLRRGELTPAIMARIDRQTEHAREMAERLPTDDPETRDALQTDALMAVPVPPASTAGSIIAEVLVVCDALLGLFSSEEYPATVEMLEADGLTEPDPDDGEEALASWEEEVSGHTTAAWLTALSQVWADRRP